MKTVVILGAGNLAFHLTRAFVQNTIHVRQIYNRTLENAKKIGEAHNIAYTDKISQLEKADLYVIAASDSAIEEISYHIPFDDVLVVHTSGSMPMSILKGNYRKGVLYALQTFSINRVFEYEDTPFMIEAEHDADRDNLITLVKRISNEVHGVTSDQRLRVHMSAVWVSNFVNHLYYIGENLCKDSGLPFDVLKPLIKETADKLLDLDPFEAQTGPAKRNDQLVVEKHLALIKDDKLSMIYKLLSNSITNTYIK